MAFTQSEITKLAGKVLAAGVISSEDNKQYYEASLANQTVVDSQSIWSDMDELQTLTANNLPEACSNADANDHIIKMYGYNADGSFNDSTAVKLTHVVGSNGHDWKLYKTHGDPSSGAIRNVISPTQIPRSSGLPSAAYQMRIFKGLPSAGNEIFTTTGFDGNEVGYFVSSANGLVMFSNADKPSASEDLYAVFFQYVGATGGGSFSGKTIILEDPEGKWRVTAAEEGSILSFDRYDQDEDGNFAWKTHAHIGSSMTTDTLILTEPHGINVDLTEGILDDRTKEPNTRSVFSVSKAGDFQFGDNEQNTVLQTKRGTDVTKVASLLDVKDTEAYPLTDKTIVMDTLTATDPASRNNIIQWFSEIQYTTEVEYVQFIKLTMDAITCVDDAGDTVDVPLRFFVKDIDGKLFLENISTESLNAGINSGVKISVGQFENEIKPHFSAKNGEIYLLGMEIPQGYKVELKGGDYNLTDPNTSLAITEERPWATFCVEYLDHTPVLDKTNFSEHIHDATGIILDNGVHTYVEGYDDQPVQVVGIGEHVDSVAPVLGNYLGSTYVATGDEGLYVLFQDDATRTTFWSEGDKTRLAAGSSPSYFIETQELIVQLEGIFESEMNTNDWDVVNLETIQPLIRYEGMEEQGYRVSIISTLVPDYKFQENMTQFEFEDRKFETNYEFNPTIDAIEPEYKTLRLPRKSFTVNRETPRYVRYQFEQPIKLYGYYKDPTDPLDPVGTGTFVPSIQCDVVKVFEEAVVTGSDLEDRVDSLEGAQEWETATLRNMATLHIEPSLQVLADEDGEWLLWSDEDSLFSSQDEHQWLFATGQEAYFELDTTQGSQSGDVFTFNPVVVHVPEDTVSGFEASFGWHEDHEALDYGVWTMYINSHGRGFDSKIEINIPFNASITWRFRQRRSGEYSMVATPMNDNLASTGLGVSQNLSSEIPVDPAPPIDIDT